MNFTLNLPINKVSFGQVSLAILREIYRRGLSPSLLPIGDIKIESSQESEDFIKWINNCVNSYYVNHTRETPTIKLWHLSGGFESVSKKQILISFYELDSPTQFEQNVAKSNICVFTNQFTCEVFAKLDIPTIYIPLGFDSFNFKRLNKKFFDDDRITFNICGKFERRKNQVRMIKSWVKKFGNNKKYSLQISCRNSFISKEMEDNILNQALENKSYFNVNNIGWIDSNISYNEFLNSADVILAMSSGEGWGIPEFSSVAIGKHSVVLNAHAYKSWADDKNSVLVNPIEGKIECYDNLFFKKGAHVNQGNYFNYNDDDFISACEEVVKRVESNRINEEGLKLQEKFNYSYVVDRILSLL